MVNFYQVISTILLFLFQENVTINCYETCQRAKSLLQQHRWIPTIDFISLTSLITVKWAKWNQPWVSDDDKWSERNEINRGYPTMLLQQQTRKFSKFITNQIWFIWIWKKKKNRKMVILKSYNHALNNRTLVCEITTSTVTTWLK